MHPELGRVAAVFGSLQGSGYLLTERLVLTSGHVAGDVGDSVIIIVPEGVGEVRGEVLYRDAAVDVALVLAEHSPSSRLPGPGPEWGEVKDLQTWPGACAVGYPAVQRRAANQLDVHQVVGRFNAGSGALSKEAVLEDLDAPVAGSPWAGLSGAAVFAGGVLVGVVRADLVSWQHRRLELVPVHRLLADARFTGACVRAGLEIDVRALATVGQGTADDFEERLRSYLAKQADRLWITGARQTWSRSGGEFWPLHDTYLSLRLSEGGPGPAPDRRVAEEALAGKRRILLVGDAGTGKTTLLQWLTSACALRSLPPELADLSASIPVLIQLRTLAKDAGLPDPEGFLAAVARPLSGHPSAQGWMTQQLAAGRVLLMIDGLDEIAPPDRDRVKGWLSDLIDAYPGNRFLVTARSASVSPGWLKPLGFDDLRTEPLNLDEAARLIDRWFDAVAPDPGRWEEHAKLELLGQLPHHADLARLATSPLICTLLCAVSREVGSMPRTRAQVFRTAARLLLESRDKVRGISGIHRLHSDQQAFLLERMALWLSLNGSVEIERGQALWLVGDSLHRFHQRGEDPAYVLDTLVVGCGMLQETEDDRIRFVHESFQHYFTACAAMREGSIGLLVGRAHDEEWSDILTLAAATDDPDRCEQLLVGLLDRLEKNEQKHAVQLTKVAKACLDHVSVVSPATRARFSALL
jgi:hypothetical protein